MAHFEISQDLVNDRDVLYCNGVLDVIAREPSVEAEPVVHGYWDWLIDGYYCSKCDHKIRKLKRLPKYCERCGAKMDGGSEDE